MGDIIQQPGGKKQQKMTMIKVFYNLKTLPFQKDIDAEDIFLSTASKELFQRLEYIKQNRRVAYYDDNRYAWNRKNPARTPTIFCTKTQSKPV